MSNVIVPVEINRDEVEVLAEVLESNPDSVLMNFIVKVLKKTHEVTSDMEAVAGEIRTVNPISMCNM